MNRQYIEEHNVIFRHINGQLSAQEQEDFELYYFENPEILEAIEIERALQEGLKKHGVATASPLINRTWVPQALAASIVTAAVVFGFTALRSGTPEVPGYDVGQAQTGWVISTRSAQTPSVTVADTRLPLVLTIEVEVPGERKLSAQLVRSGDQVLWTSEQVTLDREGNITLVLPANLIEYGQYELSINDNGQSPHRYQFDLVPDKN